MFFQNRWCLSKNHLIKSHHNQRYHIAVCNKLESGYLWQSPASLHLRIQERHSKIFHLPSHNDVLYSSYVRLQSNKLQILNHIPCFTIIHLKSSNCECNQSAKSKGRMHHLICDYFFSLLLSIF